MTQHDHDDGLVHSHGWATEPPPPAAGAQRRTQGTIPHPTQRPEDHFDDGLVHSHGWACSERGRMTPR
jgi:hypothetical protein